MVNQQQLLAFHQDGYLHVKQLFADDEIARLLTYAKNDPSLNSKAFVLKDASGRNSRLSLRSELDDEAIYTAFVRSERVANSMEVLLGDEVYHFHHKMMLKEPFVGGAWEWHQDYGYWYDHGCLYPDMASCLIAVDRATRQNGCLQVLRSSHKAGRIDHCLTGEQSGADLQRVDMLKQRCEHLYCEMEPGDALFFHSNLLHCSDKNESGHSRWSLICCYNTRHNEPCIDDPEYPKYSTLQRWSDKMFCEKLLIASTNIS